MKAILVDIDGTLADIGHRLHFIQGEVKNWPAFFDGCADDQPIWAMIGLVRAILAVPDLGKVFLVTGRPDSHRKATGDWLVSVALGEIETHCLRMRKTGDYRPDHITKRELLQQIRAEGYEPVLAIEDRQQVVDMWRNEGLICLQCAPGDY